MPAPVIVGHSMPWRARRSRVRAGLVGGLGDRLAALLPAAQMLRRAVIGLQSGKGEVRRVGDLPREVERRLARLDAAAVAAHVDLDIDRQGDPGLARRRVERADLARIVGAHADPGAMRQRRQPPQFLPADDLVGDEHVRDPAIDHRLGLADLLHAHADGAELDLLQRDDRAFVGLGVRPRLDRRLPAMRSAQAAQIALEGVEIDDQGRGVDLVERHADLGGRAGGHGGSPECRVEACAAAPKCNRAIGIKLRNRANEQRIDTA